MASESTVSNTELSEFLGPHRVLGRELNEFLSAYYLCAKVNAESFPLNSPSSPQNSVSSLFRNSALEAVVRPLLNIKQTGDCPGTGWVANICFCVLLVVIPYGGGQPHKQDRPPNPGQPCENLVDVFLSSMALFFAPKVISNDSERAGNKFAMPKPRHLKLETKGQKLKIEFYVKIGNKSELLLCRLSIHG